MAVTAAIVSAVAAVGGTAYSAVSANQRSQQGKGQAAAALAAAPDNTAERKAADLAQQKAREDARKKALGAVGRSDTILTSSSGLATTPASGKPRSTLLGL